MGIAHRTLHRRQGGLNVQTRPSLGVQLAIFNYDFGDAHTDWQSGVILDASELDVF
jgi:hypothetical protein